jgi:hypothetical protein
MKITPSKLLYNLIVNALVCLALAFAGARLSSPAFDWVNLAINFSISFVIAMLIGLFVPLTAIGKWFTGLFRVPNKTYTGNPLYRLLATFISSCIFYFTISPVLALTNFFLLPNQDPNVCLINWLINIPLMLLVGFCSTLLSDLFGYRAAHSIDKTF